MSNRSSNDRTVHARCSRLEVVRYDRAGKWYVEYADGRQRVQVPIRTAAFFAENYQAEVFFGRKGGSMFDRIVRGDA